MVTDFQNLKISEEHWQVNNYIFSFPYPITSAKFFLCLLLSFPFLYLDIVLHLTKGWMSIIYLKGQHNVDEIKNYKIRS